MSTLLYKSEKDIKVERDYLQNLQTPPPMGSRHAPYPFYNFVQDTVNAVENAGFDIKQEEYAIQKDEQRLFGLLHVSKPKAYEMVPGGYNVPAVADKPEAWNLLVALRGAHDQSISRGLAIGSQVMVCSNLCFHGDLGNWKSKQTTNIAGRIPDMVSDAVSGLDNALDRLTVDFDAFNAHKIEREAGENILVDIYRSGGFSSSQLGRAIDDWDKCSVEEHTANGRNLWWLFNSATHALKPTGANNNHADLQHRSTLVFSHLSRRARPLIAA